MVIEIGIIRGTLELLVESELRILNKLFSVLLLIWFALVSFDYGGIHRDCVNVTQRYTAPFMKRIRYSNSEKIRLIHINFIPFGRF